MTSVAISVHAQIYASLGGSTSAGTRKFRPVGLICG